MNGGAGTGTVDRGSPRGWLRFLLRAPILIYRLKLGWLLGQRFLLLAHTGRKSGKPRNTVLEVLRFDTVSHRCVIASGWGTRSQWYRNVLNDPRVRYTVGLNTHAGRAAPLPLERAVEELQDYARRHPAALRKLTQLMIGETYVGSPDQYARLAARVPLLELDPERETP